VDRKPDDAPIVIGSETIDPLRQPPSQDEIKRRKKVLKRTLKLRRELPPLEMSTAELVRQARREEGKGIDG